MISERTTDISYSEDNVCMWKRVMNDSLDGAGTSFEPGVLTPRAARCRVCSGCDSSCCIYQPVG